MTEFRMGMPENSEPNYKCGNCGAMVSVEGENKKDCFVCGNQLNSQKDNIIEASNEDY
ncbi:rRNA maturation endonuclease Nob1 [Desulfitispora alkaliphila]|uniref:hypothetical protein n=1 Tax=Desulfitispora alkaliphila TaxID=622674 RepID=UPI003D201514